LRSRRWWAGTAATIVGQVLGGAALIVGDLAVVEPLLSVSLLVSFGVAARLIRHAPRWEETLGALLLTAALAVFLAFTAPHSDTHARTVLPATAIGTVVVLFVNGVLVAVAKRRRPAIEAIVLSTAAGIFYGLQDVAVRGALVEADNGGAHATAASPWPYLAIGIGVLGLFVGQSAFGAARLDLSLPAATAAEPVAGIALAAVMLNEKLPTGAGTLAVDALCFVALIGSVVLIGRSPALSNVTDQV
jgi:hypothetical protein